MTQVIVVVPAVQNAPRLAAWEMAWISEWERQASLIWDVRCARAQLAQYQLTQYQRELVAATRAAQAHEQAVSDEAAQAAETIEDGNASPESRRQGWNVLLDFLVDVGIDVVDPARSAGLAGDRNLRRVYPPDVYSLARRLLGLGTWRSARIAWPWTYLRGALRRNIRKAYVHELERVRKYDETHVDADAADAADELVAVDGPVSVDLGPLVAALRRTGDVIDSDLAEIIVRYVDSGCSKTAVGDADYQKLLYHRTSRLQPMAQRVGLERIIHIGETVTVCHPGRWHGKRSKRVKVVLSGTLPLLHITPY